MNKKYSFYTEWQLEAPLNEVWDAIYFSTEWPAWWKGVNSVKELDTGDEHGIGSIRSYTLSSPMAYTLSFQLEVTEHIHHQKLAGFATGELEGTGIWRFSEKQGITTAICHWEVETTIRWMNFFSFLLAPIFIYNHKKVMEWGAKSLAKKLNCTLIHY